MTSHVVESYLETIYNMSMEDEAVIGARLADKLGLARPTVTEMIRRLVSDGYAVQHPDKSVTLTPEGQEVTEQALRRHRLAERLLFDVLGMDWISAHEQAHAMEHWISDEVQQRISNLLGNPTTCPHGNPIPGNAPSGTAFLREQQAFRLTEAQPGQTVSVVLISEVVEDETELLKRLSDKGLHPHAEVTLLDANSDTNVVFQTDGQIRSLDRAVASKIWVKQHSLSGHPR